MEEARQSKDTTTKSDVLTGGLYVLKSKKMYYAVLKERVLEVYKSAKDEKPGKEPKFLFDLSLTFNVHLHYDAVLRDCIALMMPDETFLMRFETDVECWFEMLIDKARQARSTKLGRPVFREEYFEVAWDVEPVRKPKIGRKTRNEEPVEDLVAKNENFLLGKKRLCMYPHTLYIVRKGITASEDANPPFCSDDYMAFPVNAISIYGHQDRYFFFRAGRCAPTGAGELWLFADTGEAASSINDKIIKICERESEKRKAQGRIPTMPARSLRNQVHRDRSHTHTHRLTAETGSIKSAGHKLSTSSFTGFPNSHPSRQSIPELSGMRNATSPVMIKNSSFGVEVKQQGPKFAYSRSPLNEEEQRPRQSLIAAGRKQTPDVQEQTDSSGGTVTLGVETASHESSNPLLCYDYAEKEFRPDTGTEISPVVSATSKLSISQTSSSPSAVQTDRLEGYTQMDCNQDRSHQSTPASDMNYTLTEVRSYVSSSTDSVESMKLFGRTNFSAPTSDDQRAYSLGSRPLPCLQSSQLTSHPSTVPSVALDCTVNKNVDDLRKRAHSLGSKSWMKPLRKVSGLRANAEYAESDDMRQRSDSFGTSCGKRAGSFSSRKGSRPLQGDQQADDLTEWDFGATGRSGSSSMASVDGSTHSRTSSFGVSSSALLRSAVEDVRKARNEMDLENPFDKIWSASNLEEMNSNLLPTDDNEYVLSSYGSAATESSIKTTSSKTTSNPRLIGTIMEQNASSGSSRSQSPLSFKAKESCATEEALTVAQSAEAIKQSSSALKILRQNLHVPMRASCECSRSVSDGAVLEGEHVDLDYATLDWLQSDVSATSSQSNLPSTGSLISRNDSKTKCEYTVIRPYNP